jgi:DNA mismatch endonuclease, patch repair protein
MANVPQENTRPEIQLRSILHGLGFRFRVHRRDLPGVPDVVLPRFKTVIFMHGCFWHQHKNCRRSRRPATNQEFWNRKFERNILRDKATGKKLRKLGWIPIVVWECQLRDVRRLQIRLKLRVKSVADDGITFTSKVRSESGVRMG